MGWLIQQVLPLLIFLLFTSSASCSKLLENPNQKELLSKTEKGPEELLQKTTSNSNEPVQGTFYKTEEPLEKTVTKEPAKKAMENEEKLVEELSHDLKQPLSKTQSSDDEQLYLWSPYERGLNFSECLYHYLHISGYFEEKAISGLMTDEEGGIPEILTEKTKSGKFSKKHLERSMNIEVAGFMVDINLGDISNGEMTVIVDAMEWASRDTIGKEHSSVNEIIKIIGFYEKIVGDRANNNEGYGGSVNEQCFLWSPYKTGIEFLKRVFNYLRKSGYFKEEQISGLITEEEGDMIAILKGKTEAGRFSEKHLETSMNFDMSGFMYDICRGDVSDQDIYVIAGALTQASKDTTGKECSSVKEIIQFIKFYKNIADVRADDDDDDYGGSAARAGGTESSGSAARKGTEMPVSQCEMVLNELRAMF